MAERRPGEGQEPPAPPATDETPYDDEEEAEVRKRLEDLGYVE
jgi:hypothetical protein